MSTKLFNQFYGTKLKAPREINAKITIGGTGAPTLVSTTNYSNGVTSISRTSTGLYVLTLVDVFPKLIGMNVTILHATNSTCIPGCEIVSETVATTKIITFKTLSAANTVADPASGSIMYIRLLVDASKN